MWVDEAVSSLQRSPFPIEDPIILPLHQKALQARRLMPQYDDRGQYDHSRYVDHGLHLDDYNSHEEVYYLHYKQVVHSTLVILYNVDREQHCKRVVIQVCALSNHRFGRVCRVSIPVYDVKPTHCSHFSYRIYNYNYPATTNPTVYGNIMVKVNKERIYDLTFHVFVQTNRYLVSLEDKYSFCAAIDIGPSNAGRSMFVLQVRQCLIEINSFSLNIKISVRLNCTYQYLKVQLFVT